MLRAMRNVFLALLFLHAMPVSADMQIQTIQLQGRAAEEIIPILQPMLAPGGSLSGTGYKLIVRSTPENIGQLRALLAEIDSPPEQLLIFVSDDVSVLDASRQHAGRITINKDGNTVSIGNASQVAAAGEARLEKEGVKIEGQASQRYQTRREPVMQQVRVTEGLWASIQFGQAIPYASRSLNPDGTVTETVTFQPVTSGFQVLPRIQGDTVTLSIRPQRQSAGGQAGGAYDTSAVDTTVRVQLGEWVELGGSKQTTTSYSGVPGSAARQSHSGEQQRIFVKIERITR